MEAQPSFFVKFINVASDTEAKILKGQAFKLLMDSSLDIMDTLKHMGFDIAFSDFTSFIQAKYSNVYGKTVPPQGTSAYSTWSAHVKVVASFRARHGNQPIAFIDRVAGGLGIQDALKDIVSQASKSRDLVMSRCMNVAGIGEATKNILKQFQYDNARLEFKAAEFKTYLSKTPINPATFYYLHTGKAYEVGERPAYRDVMEFKSALRSPKFIENMSFISKFKSAYPKSAINIQRLYDKTFFPSDPLHQAQVEKNIMERGYELAGYFSEKSNVVLAQSSMTSLEVLAFNAKIAQYNIARDKKLNVQYDSRDEAIVAQMETIIEQKKKTPESLKIRMKKLDEFIQEIKCRFSVYNPPYNFYGDQLKDDLNLKSNDFSEIIIEGVIKILNEVYPSAHDYFTRQGPLKYPKALATLEQVPFPDTKEMDNAFRMVMGYGTFEYAEKRLEEYLNLISELNKQNSQILGSAAAGIKKDYYKLVVKEGRPTFPFVGSMIRKVDSRSEFISDTEKEGFLEIEGLGFINFALAPAPLTLGIDIAIDHRKKLEAEYNYEIYLSQKRIEEEFSQSFLGKARKVIKEVSKTYGYVLKYLTPQTLIDKFLTSNPVTSRPYRELDKLSGGTLTGIHRVGRLPGRALRGEPISKEQIQEATDVGLKVSILVASGGSAAAAIGVASGQMKNGTLGRTAFGRTLLGAVEIGAYAFAVGQSLQESLQYYAKEKSRSAVQVEFMKKTGLDDSMIGAAFGASLFSNIDGEFSVSNVLAGTGKTVITGEAAKLVEEETGGIVKGKYVEKYVGKYIPNVGPSMPPSSQAQAHAQAMKEINVYKKKALLMERLSQGKIPKPKELKLLAPEANLFLDKLKEVLPEGQLAEGMHFSLDLGLPKFSLPKFGLPDIDFPDIDLPDFSLPDALKIGGGKGGLFDFKLPNLKDLGINIPKLPGLNIPKPDFKLPSVDIKRIVQAMMPSGIPLFPALNVDRTRFNFIDVDGNVRIRPELQFSPFEHAMIKYGLLPRHLTIAQRRYLLARELEYKNALIALKQVELAQKAALVEIYQG